MEESDTYMAIIDEGREKQAKRTLLRQGSRRFGHVSPTQESALLAITDLERLDHMLDRIFDANSWQDLLDTP
jgi:hypothetical protein